MPDPIITHRAEKLPLPLHTPVRFSFPIDFSERKLLLGLVDLILLNLSLLVVVAGNLDAIWPIISQLWLWLILLSGLWLAIGLMLDIYHLPRTASAFHSRRLSNLRLWPKNDIVKPS